MPDPVRNAFAAQPSNNLAYIGPTPRNRFMGGIADLLALGYKLPNMPRMGVPGLDFAMANRNKLLDMLGVGDVQKTAEALSYGNRVGTGAGMTYQPLPETLGAAMTVAPMVAPAARMAGQGVMATGRFVAPKAGQLAEQYMVRTGGILPLDVYHGTPHTLPPTPNNPLGEFDASKIGTGEGAQSYGHGIYTAENPAVAAGYAEQLSTAQGPLGDVAKYWRKNGGESAFRAFAKDAGLPPAEIESTANVIRNTGNLYKVDLPDEKIAQMIDYDKPMAEQRNVIEKMRKALVGSDSPLSRSEQFQINDYLNDNVRMRNLHPQLVVDLNDPRIVERLRQVGIPGVKYFDEGSRGAEAGKQTRNFVVFPGEEKSMTILERNGQPAQMSVADQIDNINEVLKKKRTKTSESNALMSIPNGLTRAEQASIVQSHAENFAAKAKELGLSASVEHSGSKAGPSSYVSISDPITGKKFNSPFRFSGHSKGPTQNQFVYDVGNDFSKELDLLESMASSIPRAERDAIQNARQAKMLEQLALAEKERLFSQGRPAVQSAMQEANSQQAPYTKAFSNSGNFLGPQTRSPR